VERYDLRLTLLTAARDEDEDPVTAEYDVFLTPHMQEQIYLLQYPNRVRERPYNARMGANPEGMRIKPEAGYLETDVRLNTSLNFNKYQGLKWGDALHTAREVQNSSGTYGAAAGFQGVRSRRTHVQIKDKADREHDIANNLTGFSEAEAENKVMKTQTLGGQIVKHDGKDEAGTKPMYFIGAFRGSELHLTKVDGTVQMRPQFHHIDAEEQRTRMAASRDGDGPRAPGDPRSLLQKNQKQGEEAEKDRLENRTRATLQAAEAESWLPLDYVDEDEDEAYETWRDRMFVRDVKSATKLESAMDADEYLDAISAPRRESPTRRRKKPARRKAAADTEDGEGDPQPDDADAERL